MQFLQPIAGEDMDQSHPHLDARCRMGDDQWNLLLPQGRAEDPPSMVRHVLCKASRTDQVPRVARTSVRGVYIPELEKTLNDYYEDEGLND